MIYPPGGKYRVKYSYKESQPWAVKALERDNYTCRDCNQSSQNLVVHHLDGSRRLGTRKMNNDLDNLVTVCKYCHAIRHKQTLRFTRPSSALIEELRAQGKSYGEIGKYLGISRQRVHQIMKKYRDKIWADKSLVFMELV